MAGSGATKSSTSKQPNKYSIAGIAPSEATRDSRVLREIGQILRQTFKTNLAEGATATASVNRGTGFEATNALGGDTTTCWMPPDWTTQAELVINLEKEKTFNRVMFQEQIRDFGQRIAKFVVDAHVDGQWRQIAEGQTVGYKRICRTPEVKADKVRIRILDSRVCPTISNFALYHAPPIQTIIGN